MTSLWGFRRGGDHPPPPTRTVILHYHLFKNAGTSLDALMKQQFPGKWVTREFPPSLEHNRRQVTQWIEGNPDAVCFSSHTARISPPTSSASKVLPVAFVRHPLDRIASAYTFERGQGDAGFGSTLARNTTLRGYIETRLSMRGDRQCRNFHVHRFADMFPGADADELSRSLRAVDALPFIGVVESFGESLGRLQTVLEAEGFHEIDFKPVAHNVARNRSADLGERLEKMAAELGQPFYTELEQANRADLDFYETVAARFPN